LTNDFLVIPFAIMDRALLKSTKSIEEAWEQCQHIIALAQEKRTVLTIIWHHQFFSEIDFPGYSSLYERIIEQCKEKRAIFCISSELVKYCDL